ncbi:helix-turn-helix domain-containing protein [Cohnella sp. LGH]|uniref:helix-turn-helix domain-containing protein n=1 Tax=Cohnella sp. LGH TaxID=1619153 RepID=UPI001ADB9A4D|nr:helix-turn-helix domain-containing protein [Cohnella sp. LGH]
MQKPNWHKIAHRRPCTKWSLENWSRLSNTFNVSTAYLGQLFKKTTGDMFSNYLNRIRIEKSKELLAQTTLKSNQISTMIGFTNVTYFSNIFKKFVGVYPIEYRKALAKVTKPAPAD